jgi:transcriptional regulator with XRE-family HTH domain
VRLRDRRLESGLTQAELAARAGVSRQLVAAVEAGRNTPAVDAAIALARALGTDVEGLFGDLSPLEIVPALGEPLLDGAPVRIGRVGDHLVAAELADHGVSGASWAPPDGIVEGGAPRRFAGPGSAGVVVAGCDPALGIAEAMLEKLGRRSLLAISAPTGAALGGLHRGRVHAAVVHGIAGELPEPPVRVARWHFARWQVGLASSPRLRARSVEQVVRGRAPVVEREPAAASQQALERARRAFGVRSRNASAPRAAGHLDGARMASILGAAAVTTEGAARTFGLRFVALEEHAVEIWVDERWLGHPGIDALGGLLASAAFTQRVASFGGYDLARCGEPV